MKLILLLLLGSRFHGINSQYLRALQKGGGGGRPGGGQQQRPTRSPTRAVLTSEPAPDAIATEAPESPTEAPPSEEIQRPGGQFPGELPGTGNRPRPTVVSEPTNAPIQGPGDTTVTKNPTQVPPTQDGERNEGNGPDGMENRPSRGNDEPERPRRNATQVHRPQEGEEVNRQPDETTGRNTTNLGANRPESSEDNPRPGNRDERPTTGRNTTNTDRPDCDGRPLRGNTTDTNRLSQNGGDMDGSNRPHQGDERPARENSTHAEGGNRPSNQERPLRENNTGRDGPSNQDREIPPRGNSTGIDAPPNQDQERPSLGNSTNADRPNQDHERPVRGNTTNAEGTNRPSNLDRERPPLGNSTNTDRPNQDGERPPRRNTTNTEGTNRPPNQDRERPARGNSTNNDGGNRPNGEGRPSRGDSTSNDEDSRPNGGTGGNRTGESIDRPQGDGNGSRPNSDSNRGEDGGNRPSKEPRESSTGADDSSSPTPNSPSMTPSMSPSYEAVLPTLEPLVNITLRGVRQVLRNADRMSAEEIAEWETAMENWFRQYYRNKRFVRIDGSQNQSFCQKGNGQTKKEKNDRNLEARRRDARQLDTEITFISQTVSNNEGGIPTNEIVYDQNIVFDAGEPEEDNTSGDVDQDGENDVETEDNVIRYESWEKIASIPFENEEANERLADELKESVPSLQVVEVPLAVPEVPILDTDDNEPRVTSSRLAAMCALGGLLLIGTCVCLLLRSGVEGKVRGRGRI